MMLFMSTQVSPPKIRSIRQKWKSALNAIYMYAFFAQKSSLLMASSVLWFFRTFWRIPKYYDSLPIKCRGGLIGGGGALDWVASYCPFEKELLLWLVIPTSLLGWVNLCVLHRKCFYGTE